MESVPIPSICENNIAVFDFAPSRLLNNLVRDDDSLPHVGINFLA